MKLGLVQFNNQFNTIREGKPISGQLSFACICDSVEDKENDFAYYHTGGKGGSWTPIPVNPEVFGIHQHLNPCKTLTEDNTIYFIADGSLHTVKLIGKSSTVKAFAIPEIATDTNDLILTRMQSGGLCILDKNRKVFARCSSTSVGELENMKVLHKGKLMFMNSSQIEVSADGVSHDALTIPEGSNKDQYVMSDVFIDEHVRIPQTNEYVFLLKNEKKNSFGITCLPAGMTQVKVGGHAVRLDTKYLLMNAKCLRKKIDKIMTSNTE